MFFIHRQLEDELQAEKEQSKTEREELLLEIERVSQENEKLQNLFTESLSDGSVPPAQAYLQHEVSRLTQENFVCSFNNSNLSSL